MDQLTNTIWIGSAGDAQNLPLLRHYGIVNTLNVADDLVLPNYPDYTPWSNKVGLVDGPGNSVRKYILAAGMLSELSREGPVLLHCHEGRSRTAAVATLTLACELPRVEGAVSRAYERVCSARPLCLRAEVGHWPVVEMAYAELAGKTPAISTDF